MQEVLKDLNSKLGELVGSGKTLDSKECKEVLKGIKALKDKETFLIDTFGKDIDIFDTFVSIKDANFDYIMDFATKDILLDMFLHNGNGFYADKSEIPRGYTNQKLGNKLGHFKLSFDDYFGLSIDGKIKYKDTFLGVWIKIKDSKQLFHISGDRTDFRGGYKIDNCKLHTRDLQFNSDFKSIRWGRGSDTSYNSFCKYPTTTTLKEWLKLNKEVLTQH